MPWGRADQYVPKPGEVLVDENPVDKNPIYVTGETVPETPFVFISEEAPLLLEAPHKSQGRGSS